MITGFSLVSSLSYIAVFSVFLEDFSLSSRLSSLELDLFLFCFISEEEEDLLRVFLPLSDRELDDLLRRECFL